MKIILASNSSFRQQTLNKLQLKFNSVNPDIDETRKPSETPTQLVQRLAIAKAKKVAKNQNGVLVIGSDQVATLDGLILGKPLNHQNAIKQLTLFSLKKVVFYTSLCLYNSDTQKIQTKVMPFSVYFRKLKTTEIESYLKKEQPYHCAGSFKSEGLGITLFKKLSGSDPNTLIGLPLIELLKMLRNEGVNPLETK